MTISRRALFGKLDLTLFRGIESATAFAKLRGNPYVELTHWIHQLWQFNDSDLHRVCRHYQVDAQAVEKDLVSALSGLPSGATSPNDFSHHVEAAIERAWVLSSLEFGDRHVRSAWLLAALVQTPELRRVLLGISPAFRKIPAEQLTDAVAALIEGSPEDKEGPHDGSGLPSAMPGEASGVIADLPNGKSAHHGVTMLDEAVRAAVALSHRYIPARQLPDKAIRLLDTACARVAMSLHTPPAVVDQLRQRIAALDVELALLAQEEAISRGSETRSKRVEAANARLDAAEHELSAHEARWQEELVMVQQIHALRTKKREEGGIGAEGERPTARLQAPEEEKHLPHQDSPLVFPHLED